MHLAKSTENKPLSRGGNNTFIFITLGARCKREQLTHSWAPLSKHPMKPRGVKQQLPYYLISALS